MDDQGVVAHPDEIDRSMLAEGVTTVRSGIGELVRRQREGWAYVRP
jgi:intracellular sulfur oxidation DsrE/DsrF family protein